MLLEGRHLIEDFVRLSLGVTLTHNSKQWQLQQKMDNINKYDIILQESEEGDKRLSEFFFLRSPTDPKSVVLASVVDSKKYVANGDPTKVKRYETIYFGKYDDTYGMIQTIPKDAVSLKVLGLESREAGTQLVAFQVVT